MHPKVIVRDDCLKSLDLSVTGGPRSLGMQLACDVVQSRHLERPFKIGRIAAA